MSRQMEGLRRKRTETLPGKALTSKTIEDQTAEFIRNGGSVEYLGTLIRDSYKRCPREFNDKGCL